MKIIGQRTALAGMLLLLGWAAAGMAQEFNKTGTSGFVFLEIPASARFAALGETGITMPDAGAEGLFVNPALTALGSKRYGLSVSHAGWYVETSHQAFALTAQMARIGVLGLHATWFDFGRMEKTINPSAAQAGSYISLGEYTAGAYALGLTFARQLTDRFAFGASLNYVREEIDLWHADNVVTDIGFVFMTGYHSLRIGTFLQNFGLEAKYAREKFKMPQQLKMGLSADLAGGFESPNRLTLLLEAVQPNDGDGRLHTGLEALLAGALYLRGGYKYGYDHENLTGGVGLRLETALGRLRCDFSYMDHETLDGTARYTLVMEF